MRILALAPVLPYPATDGLRLVIAERVRGMAACGHAVTLVCFGAADEAARQQVLVGVDSVVLPSPLSPKPRRFAALFRSLVSPVPYIVTAAQSPVMAHLLDNSSDFSALRAPAACTICVHLFHVGVGIIRADQV